MTNVDQALVDRMAQTITGALAGCDLRTAGAAVYGGNVAAGAVTPLIAAAVDAARAEGYEQARKVATDYFADMGDVWGGSRSWLTTGDHVAELVQGCLREAFDEATP